MNMLLVDTSLLRKTLEELSDTTAEVGDSL